MSDNFWSSKHTWRVSANNTKWCLIGCAIGDFGTIAVMQDTGVSVLIIFALAMLNGIILSILLETYILMRQSIRFGNAIRTASGMSLISMLSMEYFWRTSQGPGQTEPIALPLIPLPTTSSSG